MPLALQYFQLNPRQQGRICDKLEKVTEILACGVESGQAPGVSEGNIKPNPEVGTASVAGKGKPAKSGYLTFYPSGMSTINWR